MDTMSDDIETTEDASPGLVKSGWTSPRERDVAMTFLAQVSAIYSTNGECSALLDKLVDAGEFRSVVEYEVPTGISLEDYIGARQIQGLFSKNPWIDLGYNPLLEGVKAFIKAELHCARTNEVYRTNASMAVRKVLNFAERKIRRVLGPLPALSELKFRFGPGANTSTKMAEASLSGKLSATLACSEDLLPFAGTLLEEVPDLVFQHCIKDAGKFPLWCGPDEIRRDIVPLRVDEGKLVFVPKSAKTHRPIVVEPILNGFAQLGVGSYLKSRLSAYGLDLTNQYRNRKLSRKGSVDGSLATIDLSSASDTISIGVVLDLLPPEWSEFLGLLRTGTIGYDGVSVELEKFSSMGNGYTFELESLIFWALALGCCHAVGIDDQDVGVYGDDIIIPVESVPLLLEVLSECGFWVNSQKSYWTGPFRESCGADWLSGNDVRPFFIREEISDRVLFNFHNWALRRGERKLAKLCEDWTWKHNRLYGPDGYGDGHLLGSHKLYTHRRDRRNGFCGGWFDTYSLLPKRNNIRKAGDWLLPTYSIYVMGGSNPFEVKSPLDPYVTRGSDGYVRTPIYTFATGIFCQSSGD
jgi:hypothetical protein